MTVTSRFNYGTKELPLKVTWNLHPIQNTIVEMLVVVWIWNVLYLYSQTRIITDYFLGVILDL